MVEVLICLTGTSYKPEPKCQPCYFLVSKIVTKCFSNDPFLKCFWFFFVFLINAFFNLHKNAFFFCGSVRP